MSIDSQSAAIEGLPTDELIYRAFDTLRRIFLAAADVEDIREFDNRFFVLLKEVAGGDTTLFPGLADAMNAVSKEITLKEDESTAIAKTSRQGMELDRRIAQRLTSFLMERPTP